MIARAERKHTILIMDSSPGGASSLSLFLEREGFGVLAFQDPRQSLQAITEVSPDLVIIDITDQSLNWLDFCEEIKRLTRDRGLYIPIVLLTDPGQMQNTLLGFERGADEFIVKPPWVDSETVERGALVSGDAAGGEELLIRIRVLLRIREMQEGLRQEHQRLSRAHRAMKKELNEVRNIQQSFLTSVFPQHPDLEIVARYLPSAQVGGDYYDVIALDKDHWGFVIADIAGHGASAAVVMALTQMTVKEFAPGILRPGQALELFNKKLNYHLTSDHFVTMFYAVLNLSTMTLTYTAAGHAPALLYSRQDNEVRLLKTEPAFPLRTFDNSRFDEQSLVLQPGDRILFYTDGVTDLQNSYDHLYGLDRLREIFARWGCASIDDIAQAVLHDTEWFRGSRERHDDITLMLAGRK